MPDWGHVWERFVIHVFAAGSVTLGVRYGVMLAERAAGIRLHAYTWLFAPIGIVALLIFLREPIDVAGGSWVWKSYFDFASWLLGSYGATWLSRQTCARDHDANLQLLRRKQGRKEI